MTREKRNPGRPPYVADRVWDVLRAYAASSGSRVVDVRTGQIAADCAHHGGAVHRASVASALRELVRRGWIELTYLRRGMRVEVIR